MTNSKGSTWQANLRNKEPHNKQESGSRKQKLEFQQIQNQWNCFEWS